MIVWVAVDIEKFWRFFVATSSEVNNRPAWERAIYVVMIATH
jgi:hypothetical protein